jgi:hypothetical protein
MKARKKELEAEFTKLKSTAKSRVEKSLSRSRKASPDLDQSMLESSKNEADPYLKNWEEKKQLRQTQFKVHDLGNSNQMAHIFKLHERKLKIVFDYYSEIDFDPYLKEAGFALIAGVLPFRNFLLFLSQFAIMGLSIDVHEVKAMYKALTKGKTLTYRQDAKPSNNLSQTDHLASEYREMPRTSTNKIVSRPVIKRFPVGLTFDQFKEALFRLAVKHKEFFQKGAEQVVAQGQPMYLKLQMQYIDLLEKKVHLYDDIANEKDEYPDIDNFVYQHLEAFFVYLSLPESDADIIALLDQLRAAYHHAKPDRVKERPKKAIYEKIHTVNEIIRDKREKLYGPSEFRIRKERVRSARQQLQEQRKQQVLLSKQRATSSLKKPGPLAQSALVEPAR